MDSRRTPFLSMIMVRREVKSTSFIGKRDDSTNGEVSDMVKFFFLAPSMSWSGEGDCARTILGMFAIDFWWKGTKSSMTKHPILTKPPWRL